MPSAEPVVRPYRTPRRVNRSVVALAAILAFAWGCSPTGPSAVRTPEVYALRSGAPACRGAPTLLDVIDDDTLRGADGRPGIARLTILRYERR